MMFKSNKKLGYALIALKHMFNKHQGELTSAKELSEHYKIPFDAISRVLQTMTRAGLLRSEQGIHGGYIIQKDFALVSFLDLIQIIMGSANVTHCMSHKECDCALTKTCNIVSPIEWLNARLKSFYATVTLKQLLGTERPTTSSFAT